MSSPAFYYDDAKHEYTDVDGNVLPHITGMLERCGHIDDRWYEEEHSIRGTHVHKLTADYDLGALDPKDCVSVHRGYLLGHVAAMEILRPEILEVEVPRIHPEFRYGGRIDRILKVYRQLTILELKSGQPLISDVQRRRGVIDPHAIQTALQAMLAATEYGLPPEAWTRYALYLKRDGKFKLIPHDKRSDFDEARRIIRRCCA